MDLTAGCVRQRRRCLASGYSRDELITMHVSDLRH